MGQRSVRFPDDLEALAVARAKELDRPFSWVVVKALETALSARTKAPESGGPHAGERSAASSRTSEPAAGSSSLNTASVGQDNPLERARQDLQDAMAVKQRKLNEAREKRK